ncbi:retinol dehydrogenase 11 [Aethina tumida]|uniref:retinol dehydrogenase 11 n=1 Tax=Aethina tumida TaxID=116153 RepID=UPI0021499229|nr:retinol dehydrogenase 11 [Aethina tumida]
MSLIPVIGSNLFVIEPVSTMLGVFCSTCCLFKLVAVVGALLAIAKLYIKLTTGWCRSQTCLVGKTAIVTGANTGIGYETALDFAKRGATVILACRNQTRAEAAAEKIILETGNKNVIVKIIDMEDLDSVRAFAKDINATFNKLDILVNNAGAGLLEDERIGPNKLQKTILINHYGPFLLTNLLLNLLKKSGPSRIVNVASMAAKRAKLDLDDLNAYPGNAVYGNSKLMNILFTIELANKLNGTEVTTYSLHPGIIETEFFRNLKGWYKVPVQLIISNFFKNATEGAQTTIYCSVQRGIEKLSGEHFEDCHLVQRYATAQDPSAPKRLWEKSEEMVGLTAEEKQY